MYKKVVNLRNANPLSFDAISNTDEILKSYKPLFLYGPLTSLFLGIAELGFMILFMPCLLPILSREII